MQPDILLREFKRILKPEGILLISTPNPIIANFSYGWRRLFIKKPSNPFHCMEYSLKEFCYLVERDFEIIYIGGQRFLPRLFAGYFVGIALSFPILGKCVSDGFYSSLNKSSANVKSLLKRKVPSFFILVCQRRNKLGSD
jgi:SAM-dependent methyltransferase